MPYPQGETLTERAANFRRLASLGSELRQLHLMEHPALSKLITTYPIAGNNTVEKLRWELSDDGETGRVWINPTQYFDGVPLAAWNFYIGGYQPAQKWLKDRSGRTLSFDDIMHYQRIIVALTTTDEIMKKYNAMELNWIAISTVATAVMAILTLLTLWQNRNQLKELRRQWKESQNPCLSITMRY